MIRREKWCWMRRRGTVAKKEGEVVLDEEKQNW